MYTIRTKDCKGDGATYKERLQPNVLALLKRLLEHGTRYHGDKIEEITITRGDVAVAALWTPEDILRNEG